MVLHVLEHYVISDAPPIFMKIGNLVYFRVLIMNITIIFGAKADLTPIWSKNRRWLLRHISLFGCLRLGFASRKTLPVRIDIDLT
jgi:hypothetical protein